MVEKQKLTSSSSSVISSSCTECLCLKHGMFIGNDFAIETELLLYLAARFAFDSSTLESGKTIIN